MFFLQFLDIPPAVYCLLENIGLLELSVEEIIQKYCIILSQDNGSFHRIFQFSHITGPVISYQSLSCFR